MLEASAFILPICTLTVACTIAWLFWLRHHVDR
jgi:hypothetical protein